MTVQYKLEEVDAIAKQILKEAKNKTILFLGPMGSGKTTLIKLIVKALGVTHVTNSPTFSLVNEYDSSSGKVYHFDLFRIKKLEEALDFGFEEYLQEDAWIFIEWPEIIEPLLIDKPLKIELKTISYKERLITIK